MGLEAGGNYARCLVMVVISMQLGEGNRCGRRFKINFLRRIGRVEQAT